MAPASDVREALVALNASATFNRWAGFELGDVASGAIEPRLPWREDFGQYAGFLHAAMIGAMIDTACGFAAFSRVGNVLASHFSINCLAPATGTAPLAAVADARVFRRSFGDQTAELFGAKQQLLAAAVQLAYFRA